MSDIELCPVQCFKAPLLQDHPGLAAPRAAGSQLCVKSHNIRNSFSSVPQNQRFLSNRWLLLGLWTLGSQETTSLLHTLGNWASSSTFENHYQQRNQRAQVDFITTTTSTTTVLSEPMDQFFGAPDDFSGLA
ncbi:hypothetical protein HMPREF1544_06567 [Mucor circinelloides 1006PhL]|uniref:Uncharacterized protein n=1 Tax=Mucor circinelloides f. circinelloides (strain 1006PhL) TaxID=1220926 RepID=S2J8X9_MUCC1|nr:hypothetical protein HMPREF1544_06567 [Mucor circinelloides 1006PhL]